MKERLTSIKEFINENRVSIAIVILILFIAIVLLIFLLNRPNPEEVEGFGTFVSEENIPETIESPDQVTSPDGNNSFTINYNNQGSLIIDDELKVNSVFKAQWTEDSQYILYSKLENQTVQSENFSVLYDNYGNIWSMKPDGLDQKLIKDFEYSDVVYISNGERIAFALPDKIGVMNIDGTGEKIINEFTPPQSNSDAIYIPELIYINENRFEVTIRDKDFWTNGETETFLYAF